MAKFKVGDKVRVRSLILGTEVDGLVVLGEYVEMQGTQQTICRVDHSDTTYKLEGCDFWFSEGMLEKVEEEEKVENKMEAVAKLLGVEIGEEFDIEEHSCNPYRFTTEGLIDREGGRSSGALMNLLIGKYKIIKRPFRPKKDEVYWRVNPSGTVYGINKFNVYDYAFMSIGNCFRTEEEAKAHFEEISAKCKEFFKEKEEGK